MGVAEYGAEKVSEMIGTAPRYNIGAYLNAHTRESVDISAEGDLPAFF